MSVLNRFSLAVLVATLATVGFASAQTLTLSSTGSGSSGNGGHISGGGSGTFSPGGSATVTFTGNGSSDNCTNVVQLSLNIAVTGGDTLTLLFNAQIPASLNTPDLYASGTFNGTLNVTGGTGTYSGKGGAGTATLAVQKSVKTFTYVLNGSLTLAGPLVPLTTITPNGIVPVFTDTPLIQPGTWISIYGTNLTNTTALWNGDFPTSLGGITVSINGKPGYFWFVSPGQLNLQAPDDTVRGCVPVVISTPGGTVSTSVELANVSASLSLLDGTYVAAVIPTPYGGGAYGGGTYDLAGPVGRFAFATRPVKRGETVVLYGVGLGPTQPAVPAGKVFSGAAATVNRVQVLLGNNVSSFLEGFLEAPVAFSGLVGAGLYQLNITVPANAPTGDVVVQVNVQIPNGTEGSQTSSRFNAILAVQ